MFVVGCHRSGTSYASSLLTAIMNWRRPSDLDRTVDNPRGYFESTLLRPFNDELLGLAGYAWDRPPLVPVWWTQGKYLHRAIQRKQDFEAYALELGWVDKDPRLSITFPLFQHLLLKRVPCLVPMRNPFDVAQSLHWRDGFSLEKGLLIWLLYNRGCSLFFDPSLDALISYEALIDGQDDQIDRLIGFVAPSLSLQCSDMDVRRHVLAKHVECTSPNLRRNQLGSVVDGLSAADESSGDGELACFCRDLYSQIESGGFAPDLFCELFHEVPSFLVDKYDLIFAEGEPSLEFRRNFAIHSFKDSSTALSADCQTGQYERDETIISTFADLLDTLHGLQQQVNALGTSTSDHEASSLEEELRRSNERLEQMQQAFFWRLTAPLRWGVDAFKSVKARVVRLLSAQHY